MGMLSEQFLRLTGIELHELAGSAVGGEIPVSTDVVNRLIARRMATVQGPIAGVRVEAHEGQRMTVTLSLRGRSLIPAVTIAAEIEQQPQFPHPAVLGLRWSMPALGPLARFASPALAYFKALPRGIRLEGDRLGVDLGELLRAQGLGELLGYVTRLRIETRDGGFLVRFEARL